MDIRIQLNSFIYRLKQAPRLKLFLIFLFSLIILVLIIEGSYLLVMNKDKVLARWAIQKHFVKDFSTEDDTSIKEEFLGFKQQTREIINVYGMLEKVDLQKKTLTLNLGDEGILVIPYKAETQFFIKPSYISKSNIIDDTDIEAYVEQTKKIDAEQLEVGSKLKLVFQKPDFIYPFIVFQLYDNP